MIKRNNKGFTLLELMISIFILTTVIFLGYKVINKSTMYIKNQSNIHKGQLTVNDMNEYLTKDLEQASSIVLIVDNKKIIDTSLEENSTEEQQTILSKNQLEKILKNISSTREEFTYSYNIRFREDENSENDDYSRIYSVKINKDDKDNYRYSVSREETDGVSISFVIDEILKEKELPFVIYGNNPYKVFLAYNGKNNEFEKHEFTVTSRLYEIDGSGNGSDTTPPSVDNIKPPEEWVDNPTIPINYNAIGFWTADSSKKQSDNLYTWVTDGKILVDGYATQKEENVDKFNIAGLARSGNNALTKSYIGYNNNIDITKFNPPKLESYEFLAKSEEFSKQNIVKISIYVSPHTKLEEFEIEKTQGSGPIQIPSTLESGWHHCTIENTNQVSFKFKGKLSITDKSKVSSGYAYVVYEKYDSSTSGGNSSSEDDLDDDNTLVTNDGDLIYEITRNDKLGMNPGQTLLTTIPKIKNKDGKYEEIYTNEESTNNAISIGDLSKFYIHILLNKDSGYIQTYMEKFPGKQIYNNNMYKDLTKIKEIVVKCDENTKLKLDLSKTDSNGNIEKISDNEFRVKLRTDNNQSNTYIYFDISKYYDTDEVPDGVKFKVSFTFIEDK